MNNGLSIKKMYEFALGNKTENDSFRTIMSEFSKMFESLRRLGVVLLRSKNIKRHPVSNAISYSMFKPKMKKA